MHMHKFYCVSQDLVTTAQVADRLQVSIETVNRWVREGRLVSTYQLPGARGARMFKASDIDSLAEALADELRQRLARIEQSA